MRTVILGFVAGAALLQQQAALPTQAWHWLSLGAALAIAAAAACTAAAAPAAAAAPDPAAAAPAAASSAEARLPRAHAGAAIPAPAAACRRPSAHRRAASYALLLLAGLALGFGWAAWQAERVLVDSLAKDDEGRDVTLVGTIDNLPNRSTQGVRFNFAVEKVLPAARGARPIHVPPQISLAWYNGFRDQVQEVGDVQPGERWQLTVRLQRPHGLANPMGFDYEVWLLEQGLRATGYVRPAGAANRRLDSFVFSIGHVIEHCRAVLRARILRVLPDQLYANVIVALVVGDQRGIEQADWQVFNRTGIGHLISISGLHITMVAGLFALAASALWRRSFFTRAQLPLLLPAQKVAALAGAIVALFYVLLAGFGVPAQRTLYMLIVVAAALWSNRIASVSHVLCVALGLVVLIDPWAVLWPGFWLSFGAVATIMYATVGRTSVRPPRRRPGETSPPDSMPAVSRRQRIWQAFQLGAHTQYVVTLGLVPLSMLLFAQVSIVSPIANAIAIPLVSLVITPLALAGSVLPDLLSTPLLSVAHSLVALLATCLRWFSLQPLAVWSAPTPPFWLFCWASFGTIWMLAPRGWPVRWLGAFTWLPLLSATPSHPASGELRLIAFDVGQGMALLVETSSHRLLYDTGPAYSPESNAGDRTIVPYLKARGITALDAMIVSHSDADHSGGALSVLESLPVGWVLSSLWPSHPIAVAAGQAGQHRSCSAGQHWTWDGVQFDILHPLPASYADPTLRPNARGCTLKISAAGKSVLLAADIEAPQEAALLQRAAGKLHADILLAPHHGSGTSSTPAFLQAVHPGIALFQVGYRNRYHHPKPEVYARYAAMGIQRLRSDEAGAVTLDIGGVETPVTVSVYRSEHARYWYGR
jgi:competence protein ComEC